MLDKSCSNEKAYERTNVQMTNVQMHNFVKKHDTVQTLQWSDIRRNDDMC